MSDALTVVERAGEPVRTRMLVVPDLGVGALAILVRLEAILSTLAAWEEHDDCDLVLPVPLACERALSAVRRLWDALAHTQELGEGVELEAGRQVHFIEVEQDDLDALAAIAVRLCQSASAAPGVGNQAIADALEQHVRGETTARLLVADAVRLHNVLDLACALDAEPLRAALETSLDRELRSAYVRLVSRLAKVWRWVT